MSNLSHLTPDERQAEKAIQKLDARGTPRHGNQGDGKFHSDSSIDNARSIFKMCSAFCKTHGEKREKFSTLKVETAEKYLLHRAEKIQQKQLNSERVALNKHLGQIYKNAKALPYVISVRETPEIVNRAYTHDQVKTLITEAKAQGKPELAVSIAAAYQGGLRSCELHTMMPPGIGEASTHRTWDDRIYTGGRDAWIPAIVNGKGGLKREIRYTKEMVPHLQNALRDTPQVIIDRQRNTRHFSYYKLLAGQKFSQQFGDLSRQVFGWSNGAHGLRHSFAQRRFVELKNHYPPEIAKDILAQELGHFDTSNLKYYGVS